MTIDNLSQLKKLIRMCRDEGVNRIVIDGVDITIEGTQKQTKPAVLKNSTHTLEAGVFDPGTIAMPDEMTHEQRLFGSSDPSVWMKEEQ